MHKAAQSYGLFKSYTIHILYPSQLFSAPRFSLQAKIVTLMHNKTQLLHEKNKQDSCCQPG
jgi:hypothetical protein